MLDCLENVVRPDGALDSHVLWPERAERMADVAVGAPASGLGFLSARYRELDLSLDPETRTLWCHMRPEGPPSFTPGLLRELIGLRRSIQELFAARTDREAPVRYFVGGSRLPGIYNLGGDLSLFARAIRDGDRDGLRRYAHDCVDVAYHMHAGFEVPVVTIALVQGEALGGGFEGALSFNVLVAERSARFGLPEILFGMFPGMGAYSFLSRRLDPARADQMIRSGKVFSAEEAHAMGLVDVLADDGRGEDAVRDYIARNGKRRRVERAMLDARRRVSHLSWGELKDVTDIWVDAAMDLDEADLRRMERLTNAQGRRMRAPVALAG